MSQDRIHLVRGEICGVPMLLAREDNFRRFNVALNDADLALSGSKYWMSSSVRIAQQTRHTLSRTINRVWKIEIGKNEIEFTSNRCTSSWRSWEFTYASSKRKRKREQREEERRCVTSEKRSGYWNGEIYRNWENEAACDRRNALVTRNMQGRFILHRAWRFLP